MNWYVLALTRFTDVEGRSRRRVYWWFVLCYFLFSVAIRIVESVMGFEQRLLSMWFELLMLLPWMSVSVRRLHDIGRTGWWLAASWLLPIGLILLFWMAKDGDPGPNAYGPSPKHGASARHR